MIQPFYHLSVYLPFNTISLILDSPEHSLYSCPDLALCRHCILMSGGLVVSTHADELHSTSYLRILVEEDEGKKKEEKRHGCRALEFNHSASACC